MKRRLKISIGCLRAVLAGVVIAAATVSFCQAGRSWGGGPTPPEIVAKEKAYFEAVRSGEKLVEAGKVEAGIAEFHRAIAMEPGMPGFTSIAHYDLAKALVSLNRDDEALEAFRHAFAWSDRYHDVVTNGPSLDQMVVDYALELAKRGKDEEAKAIYYRGLRYLSACQDRSLEPVPLLVVFDADPNAIVWEYTPDRFRAAVLMLTAAVGHDREIIKQVRLLAPDWFWPVAYQADHIYPDQTPLGAWDKRAEQQAALIAEADRLAKPGLEKDLMAWYHDQIIRAPNARQDFMPGTHTPRPMTEGNRRRSLIEVLKPNEALLKKLSIPFPNEPPR